MIFFLQKCPQKKILPNRRPPIDIQCSLIFRMQISQHFRKFSTNAVVTLRQITQTPVAQLFCIVYLKIEFFFISFTNFTNKIHISKKVILTLLVSPQYSINTVETLWKKSFGFSLFLESYYIFWPDLPQFLIKISHRPEHNLENK